MLKLYIVRHGETEFNVQKRMQGRLDSPLTQRGIDTSKSLGEHLEHTKFDRIFCSPSPRAVRTAEIINGNRTSNIEIEDELREMNLADWEGKSKEELEQLYPEEYKIFWNEPQLFKPKEGEDFQQVQDRAVALIKKLIAENEKGNILIVTHSVVILTIVKYFLNYPLQRLWEPPYIHGTSLTLITAIDGEIRLESIGDVCHIRD